MADLAEGDAMDTHTISGDAGYIYVSDEDGRIVETFDSLAEAESAASYYNSTQRCDSCSGTGRGLGPDVKKESPVARGLFIWTPPRCLTCDGSGRVAR